jgi:hypothetical protein
VIWKKLSSEEIEVEADLEEINEEDKLEKDNEDEEDIFLEIIKRIIVIRIFS